MVAGWNGRIVRTLFRRQEGAFAHKIQGSPLAKLCFVPILSYTWGGLCGLCRFQAYEEVMESMSRRVLLGLLLLFVLGGWAACIERLDSSLGLQCAQDSDCWDDLGCKNELCGGERRPAKGDEPKEGQDAASQPEPKVSDTTAPEPKAPDAGVEKAVEPAGGGESTPDAGGTEVAPEPAGQCQGNLNQTGQCTQDGDCCAGQTCKDVTTPMGPFKLCATCKVDDDCPKGTVCCQALGFCAIQCSQP